MNPPPHFRGKEALEHVIEARLKGKSASREDHGAELPGHYFAATDAAKETAFFLFLWIALLETLPLSPWQIWSSLGFMSLALLFWKSARSALLGWARLGRLHRLIEEERWEIEHHRPQEREELKAFYAAKGFSGKLLEEVLDVLMADDNRLLQVMLQEELGLALESYEHPLRQALGAALGTLGSAAMMGLGFWLFSFLGALAAAFLVVGLSVLIGSHLEKNPILGSFVWNLSTVALILAILYFLRGGL